jgi:HTH-like domain
MKAVADTLGVRARTWRSSRSRRKPATTAVSQGRRRRAADAHPAPGRRRPSYSYRRITALLNRQPAAAGLMQVNHKRVYRVMKRASLLLAPHTGGGRQRPHDGEARRLPPTSAGPPTCSKSHAGMAPRSGWRSPSIPPSRDPRLDRQPAPASLGSLCATSCCSRSSAASPPSGSLFATSDCRNPLVRAMVAERLEGAPFPAQIPSERSTAGRPGRTECRAPKSGSLRER